MPAGANLYQTLLAGEPPAWLRPVPLPPEVAGEVHLFAVVREPAANPARRAPPAGRPDGRRRAGDRMASF